MCIKHNMYMHNILYICQFVVFFFLYICIISCICTHIRPFYLLASRLALERIKALECLSPIDQGNARTSFPSTYSTPHILVDDSFVHSLDCIVLGGVVRNSRGNWLLGFDRRSFALDVLHRSCWPFMRGLLLRPQIIMCMLRFFLVVLQGESTMYP